MTAAHLACSMERPALQKVLDDVGASARIDVIVVCRVDQLTRSLADLRQLVELFDAHQVSFVTFTQAFNTTTSMGTIDAPACSCPSPSSSERSPGEQNPRQDRRLQRRRSIWMGGDRSARHRRCRGQDPPRGRVEHATFVRDLFRHYLEIGSVVRLKAILDRGDVRLPTRTDGTGRTTGGGLIRSGPSSRKILSSPTYLGRLSAQGPSSRRPT